MREGSNRRSPLHRGLLRLWDFRRLDRNAELLNGGAPTIETPLARDATTAGVGRVFDSTAYTAWDDDYRTQITDQITWFFYGSFGTAVNGALLGDCEQASTGYNSMLYCNTNFAAFFVKCGGSGIGATGTSSILGLRPRAIVGTYDGSFVRIYVDGVLELSNNQAGNVDQGAFATHLNRWNATSAQAGSALLGGVAKRAWSSADVLSFAADPLQLLPPKPRGPRTGAIVQLLRPVSDTTVGAWTPSTGATLWGVLDEVAADDADYITVSSASTAEVALSAGSTPVAGTQTVRFRAKGSGTLTVSAMEGASVRGTTSQTLTGAYQTFSFTVTGVTDYAALSLRFVSS